MQSVLMQALHMQQVDISQVGDAGVAGPLLNRSGNVDCDRACREGDL